MGVLSTENRKIWSTLRTTTLSSDKNAPCLEFFNLAMFIMCLGDGPPMKVGISVQVLMYNVGRMISKTVSRLGPASIGGMLHIMWAFQT